MPLPAVCPGRPLERRGDTAPRGMTVLDRTRLTGRLRSCRALRAARAFAASRAARSTGPLRDPVGEATSTPRSRLRRSLSLTQGLFRVRLWIAPRDRWVPPLSRLRFANRCHHPDRTVRLRTLSLRTSAQFVAWKRPVGLSGARVNENRTILRKLVKLFR